MIVDYHLHLRDEREQPAHRVDAVEPFVDAARAAGVDEIGFTEHVYYFRQTRPLWSIPYQIAHCAYNLDAYVDAVVEAKRRGLPVKLGLEVDYDPATLEETRLLLEPYPWDFLLGSIHYVDGHGIDASPSLVEAVGFDRAWSRYFDWLISAASSGLVDVLAHADLIRFFGNAPPDGAAADYQRLATVAAGAGVCLEVSTAGLHKPLGDLYPHREFLEVAGRLDLPESEGVRITLASDAHAPVNVGRDFEQALERARSAGFRTVTVFDSRQGRQEPLG